jgi:HlyD family secretion protein
MRVTFTVDAYPGEPFRGEIRDIRNAPQVVQNVVTYDAVIDVDNPDLKLKPGMTATVSVVTDRRRDVVTVPNAALRFRPDNAGPPGAGPAGAQRPGAAGGGQRERGQGDRAPGGGQRERGGERERGDGEGGPPVAVARTVYLLVNGEPQARSVTTGLSDGRVTEITSGLKEGEVVIVSAGGQGQGTGQRGGQGQRGFRIL